MELAQQLALDPIVPTGSGDRIIPTARNPITLTRNEISYDLAPPVLGADTEAVSARLDAL